MASKYDVIINKDNKTRKMKSYRTSRGKTIYKDVDSGLYYSNLQQNVNEGLDAASFGRKHKMVFTNTNTAPRKNTATAPKRNDLATRRNNDFDENNPIMLPEVTVTATKKKNKTTSPRKSKSTVSSRVSSSTPGGNYTVNKGDSLWRIAHNAGISLNELMRQNPQIKNINQVIRPGDKINVNGKSNTTSTNTSTSEPSTTTPSTPKYENIIFDDTKLAPAISTDLVGIPDKIEPIKYNYKKKKR